MSYQLTQFASKDLNQIIDNPKQYKVDGYGE